MESSSLQVTMLALVAWDTEAGVSIDSIPAHCSIVTRIRNALIKISFTECTCVPCTAKTEIPSFTFECSHCGRA
ncbi:hypothetical protein Y1Q_0012410 [Alligator mississippiensis]|uniref:Uncharacterized protein n=1 Tax=Alligator mississippiensis TaxID=8496 RepID=A0A151NCJ8_ALLMI|nr:hypothetical protein Y1Q_0012410 [Alligator mississippiensis]